MKQILPQLWVSWPSHFTANRQCRRQSLNPALGQEGCLQQSRGDEIGSPPEEQVNPQPILPVSFLETTFGQAEGRKAWCVIQQLAVPQASFVWSSTALVCCQAVPLPPRDEIWVVSAHFRGRRTRSHANRAAQRERRQWWHPCTQETKGCSAVCLGVTSPDHIRSCEGENEAVKSRN